jgi:hypothetical protein
MDPLLLLIVSGLLLVLLAAWWRLRKRGSRPAAEDAGRLDTLAAWPPQATRVLTSHERTLLATLMRALPEHLVLAQVPLARFIKVPKRHSYAEWLRRVGYQSVDFVVCDMASHVLAVIELQPTGQELSERARKRQARIARTLEAAGIPLHAWNESALPGVEAARAALLPKAAAVPAPAPESAAGSARATTTAATGPRAGADVPTLSSTVARPEGTRNPFDELDRDSSQDELIEAPPSTWFDDLDSAPAPLQPQPAQRPRAAVTAR